MPDEQIPVPPPMPDPATQGIGDLTAASILNQARRRAMLMLDRGKRLLLAPDEPPPPKTAGTRG